MPSIVKHSQWIGRFFPPALFIGLILGSWELTVRVTQIEDYLLPSPSQVGQELVLSFPLFIEHGRFTLLETGLGLGLASISGVAVALLIDHSLLIRRMVYPLLVVSQTIPYYALAPFFMLLFGMGLFPKVLVVSLVCFFPIAVSLATGLQSIQSDYIQLLKTMNAGYWQIFRYGKWPAALPSLFSGLRIASTYSVMAAVIGELFGGSYGLGILLSLSAQSYLADRVFATIVVIITLSLAIYLMIEGLARISMRWHYKQNK